MLVSHSQLPQSRKRKAEDDSPQEDLMRTSPTPNTRPLPRQASSNTSNKRSRPNLTGRALTLPRLLETLDADSLRSVIQTLSTRHPALMQEIESTAPRPSVPSALQVLKTYESALDSAFPLGNDRTSDYAYNRVRQPLLNLLDALADYVPHFLPPHEGQVSNSLAFLDGATEVIHRLPEWSSFQHSLHKQSAYEEISRAWAVVIREAAKPGAGMGFVYGGWEGKVARHNQVAGGRLQEAVNATREAVGWLGGNNGNRGPGMGREERGSGGGSVRQELLDGRYGAGLPVRVGLW